MADLLDPKNDYVFKRLFADDPVLLCSLINAVRRDAPPVHALTVSNPAIAAEELHGKYIILDLLAEDADGKRYNIEMQVRRYRAVSARSLYYLARIISGQLVVGDAYDTLKSVIGIHFLDFDLFQDAPHSHQAEWCFAMRDAKTPGVCLGQELQLYVVELRKAARIQTNNGHLAAWIALFQHWQEDNVMSQITDDPVRSAYEKLKALSADPDTRWLAFQRERALLEEQTLLSEAREEGRAETQRETAERMLRLTQMDDATIAALSGLDQADVTALRQAAR